MDSTPALPDPAPTPARPRFKKIKGLPPIPILSPQQLLSWILISLMAHLLLLGFMANKDAILMVVGIQPASEGEPSAGGQDTSTSVDRIEAIVQDVRDHQADQIREKVAELLEAQAELAKADERMVEEYRTFAEEMLEKSGDQIGETQAEAMDAQKDALAAQDAVAAAQKEMRETVEALAGAGAGDRPGLANQLAEKKKQVQAAQRRVEEAQKAADAAQAEAAKSLNFAETAYSDAALAQQEAKKAQSEAGTTQQMAIVSQSEMGDLTKKIDQTEEALKAREQKLNEAKQNLEKANQRLSESEASLETAKAKLAEQETAQQAVAAGEDKKAIKNAENAVKGAKKAVENSNSGVTKAKKNLENVTGQLAKQQEAYDKAKAEAEAAPKAALAQVDNVLKKQEAARKEQEEALAAQAATQAQVLEAQAKAAEAGKSGAPKTSAALEQAVVQAKPLEAPKNLDDKSLGELLKLASDAEKSSTEIYREMRSAETATQRQMTLDEARKITDIAKPERNALDSELLTKEIKTAEEARAHTAAVREAVQQIDSMISLAREIKQEVQGAPASLEAAKASAEQTAALEAQAEQDYGQRAKDLSELMKAASGVGGSPAGSGGAHGVHAQVDPSAFFAPVAEQQANAQNLLTGSAMLATLAGGSSAEMGVALANLTKEQTGRALADMAAAAAQAEQQGAGGSGGGGGGVPADAPMTGGDMAGIEELNVNGGKTGTINAITGRKIMKGAPRSSPWMFVDTWYILGPFPNPSRVNIDKQFPPESVVDLDATYRGKDNRMIKWEFFQSGKAEVRPPGNEEYQIYYAYTELWFEEAADRWIAVGSDDYSKLWIEGMLVWKSGEQLKGWNPKEGYRKVHFKKGLNRILYRVENGWHGTQFSLCINLQEPNLTQAQLAQ